VQPTILTLRLRVDHVFAVLYRYAAAAYWALARRERRLRPLDRFANILSTNKFERHLIPPMGAPGRGTGKGSDPCWGWSKWGGVVCCSQRVAAGAAIGATAGHVAAGMSRSDLMEIGELLDAGTSGLVVVAATDVEDRVEAAIQRGKDIVKKQVQVDADGRKADIDSL
jgi:hypothetical protein